MRPDEWPKNDESPAVAGRPCSTGATGLEPATSGVTGRRSNQTELRPPGRGVPVWHGIQGIAARECARSCPGSAPVMYIGVGTLLIIIIIILLLILL
jgi:hypothetical protein